MRQRTVPDAPDYRPDWQGPLRRQDSEGGMVTRLQSLSPVWVELASQQVFEPAQCSPALRQLALQVVLTTAQANTKKLLARG